MEVKVNIKGYRQLSDAEQATINAIKDVGTELGALIAALAANPDYDQRWVSIARTDLQTGVMALVRSVAKPEGF